MSSLLASRWVHNTILVVLMAIVILAPPDLLPRPEIVSAAFILLAWVLGEHYERLTVIEAGLADREELKAAEQDKRGWGIFK